MADNDFLFQLGIDASSFVDVFRQMKASIIELQNISKQSGATISQTFSDAANSSAKLITETSKATTSIAQQGKAAKDTATTFQSIFDQLTKVATQNGKAFDITSIAKYFNSIKSGTLSLSEFISKQGQSFDTAKVVAFNEELQKSKGSFDDLRLTLDFIKNNLGDLSLSPEGAQQLTQSITVLENALDTAATKASEIGINLNNPEAAAALNNIQTEVSKTVVDFDQLNTAIQNGKKALDTLPAGSNEFNTLSTAVSNATTVLNENAASIDQLKIKLSNLEATKGATSDLPTIALLNQQIDATKEKITEMEHAGEEGFDNLGKKIQANSTQASTLLIQYRNLRNEIGQLKQTDPTNPKIPVLTQQAATLENTIKNVNRELALASSNTAPIDATIQGVQGLVGVFGAASTAMALFGNDSDQLKETLIKVAVAMQFLQSIQQAGQAISKEGALNTFLESTFRDKATISIEAQNKALIEQAVLTGGLTEEQAALSVADARLAVTEGEAAAGQEALNTAMELNPAAILLISLAALAAGISILVSQYEKAHIAEQIQQEISQKSIDSFAKEEAQLNINIATAKDKNLTDSQRQGALDKIISTYPEYLHSLSLDNIYTDQSSQLISKQIDLLKQRALAQAAQDVYIEKLKAVVTAEEHLQEIQNRGAGYWEKIKGQVTNLGSALLGTSAQENALKNATDDVDEANKSANISFDIMQKNIDGVSQSLRGSLPDFSNFVQQIGNVSKAAQTPIPFTTAQPTLNQEDFDKTKKASLDLAQYRVDVATKGTIEEIEARRDLLIKQDIFEQKDIRTTQEQKLASEGKFIGDLASIDNELLQKRLANQTAFAQAQIALTQEGTKANLNAQLSAIDAETKQAIAAQGIQSGEVLKIIAEAEKKKQDLRRAFQLQELSNEISVQKAIVSEAVDGTQEEYVAKQKIIELSAEQEIISAKGNADKIKEINAKLNDDLFELMKQHNADAASTGINIQIDDIDAQLAGVEKGTEEELKLLEERNTRETQLQLVQAAATIKNESELEAARNKITAEGLRKNNELENQFFQQKIDNELKFKQSLLALSTAQAQTVVNDPLATTDDKRNAQKQILQNELDDIKHQREALIAIYLFMGGDRQKFQTDLNNIDAQAIEKRKELFDLDLNTFSFKGALQNLGDNLFKSAFSGITDPTKQQEAKDLLNKALSSTFSSLGSVFDSLTKQAEDNAQKQIDAIQKVIDATQEQISAQDEVVKHQQELSDKGLANDLQNQQKKLDELKANLAEENKQRQQAQKNLEKIQKQQAVIQAASIVATNIESAVNMINAATKLYGSFSAIPLGIGIPIAAAVIAGMFASFLSIKAAFTSAATTGPTIHRQGGGEDLSGMKLNGPSHENKGIGLYNNATGEEIAQYEGDEYLFAINKQSTKKYLPILESINRDMLPITHNTKEMRSLLSPDSARLPMERIQEIIVLQKEVQQIELDYRREDMLNLNRSVDSFHKTVDNANKNKKHISDYGDYVVITENGRTRKIWKIGKRK
jgi:hypothetical protein